MPDWVTHIVVAWTLCMILSFKYKQFDTPNTIIVMIGSLIPDIYKIYIPLDILGLNLVNFLVPIHLPIGSLIMTTIIALLFKEKQIIFLLLLLGVLTHYILDSLLMFLTGGMYLLFPLSWNTFNIGIIPTDDYYITILAIIIALIIYLIHKYIDKRKIQQI